MKSLLVAALLVATPAPKEDLGIDLPIKCGEMACVMPKQTLMDIIDAHNALIDEVRRLKFNCHERST